MKITKLNDDSSWLIDFTETTLLIDPIFESNEMDNFQNFSNQFNNTNLETTLKETFFIFVSNKYNDHCHKSTLLKFNENTPIIGEKKVLNKIKKWAYFKNLYTLNEAPFTITKYNGRYLLDLKHASFLIEFEDKSILYAPHGTKSTKIPKASVLIATTSKYQLPFWLGGTINLGYSASVKLLRKCQCRVMLSTHSKHRSHVFLDLFARKKHVNKKNVNTKIKFLQQGETLSF